MSSTKTPNAPGSTLRAATRRDVLRYGGGALTAAAILPSRSAFAARKKLIRFAHNAPVAHGWNVWAEKFKETIEADPEATMTVQIFPDAQMGNERDIAQAVKLGSLEMGAIGVGLMSWVPEVSVTDAPFLWESREQSYSAFDGELGDTLRKLSLDRGFKLVGFTDLGFRAMTNNVRTITSADDMKALKMRVPNSKSYIAMMQSLGATTVAVDLSELYLALRQGVADGQDTPVAVVVSNKLYEVQSHISKTEHVLTTAYVVANPEMFDGLTDAQKEAFLAASRAADEFLRKKTQEDEAAAFGFLGEHGMEVTLDVDGKSFRDATAPVLKDNPDLFPPELVAMARATAV